MASLKEHLLLKVAAFDFMQDSNVCPNPPLGTVANPRPTYILNEYSIGEVMPIGSQVDDRLSDADFLQLKECFAVEYQSFRELHEAYTSHVRRITADNRIRGRISQRIPQMKDWEPDFPLSEKQQSMMNIQPKIRVHYDKQL